jgi:hypothetical protein
MAAVWALVRARLRARRRALVGLALLVAVASGAVMAAAIGARRTDTAYARLLEATRADDAEVEYGGFDDPAFRVFVDRLRRLPKVADLGVESQALLAPAMPGDPREYTSGTRFFSVASVDGRVGRTINRPLILAGRRPDPDRVDEIGVSEYVARRWGLRPGGTFRVRAVAPGQLQDLFTGVQVVPAGRALALKVVAVQRLPDDPAIAMQGTEGVISLTPAFYRAYRGKVANLLSVRVHLKGGQAGMGGFAAAARLAGNGVDITVVPRPDLTRLVEDATRAQAVALVLFAALAAAAALVPIGLVGAAGAVFGAGVAVLASPLTPMGLALRAEPAPGLSVHPAGLGIGMAATLVLVLGRVAAPAWRLAGERPHQPGITGPAGTTSALADTAARAGLPPTSVTGCAWRSSRGGARGQCPYGHP